MIISQALKLIEKGGMSSSLLSRKCFKKFLSQMLAQI